MQSFSAAICTGLLVFNCAAPVSLAQTVNGTVPGTASATGKNNAKPASLSPDVVAPVSPPPIAPQATNPSGNPSHPNYDPLNPEPPPAVSATSGKAAAKNPAATASKAAVPHRNGSAQAPLPGKGNTNAAAAAAHVAPHIPAVHPKAAAPASPPTANQSLLKPEVPKIAEPVEAPPLNKSAGAADSLPTAATPASALPQAAGTPAAQGPADTIEKYPAIANLEALTFGETHPGLAISDRLANLETTVFKETHPTDSLFVRTERLQKVLVGNEVPPAYEKPQARPPDSPAYAQQAPQAPPSPGWSDDGQRGAPMQTGSEGPYSYFDEIAMLPENRVVVNSQQLQDYFIEMVNNERRKVGSPPLDVDPIAEKLATEHVTQLAERAQVSHTNFKGENPDRRYTLLGGTDAVTESLVSLKNTDLRSRRLYRGAAAKLLKVLMSHQDDKEALCSRDTTHVGFAAEWTSDKSRLIACAELVSRHAIIHPVPDQAHIDEKIEVKGVMNPPYQFVRVTLAWEGGGTNLSSVADESDEALPYFPPLDYVAFQRRSESGGHDKAIMILKGVGIAAAIAGGVFMPPVALAAPLIMVSGGQAEHKPSSEIPVKGGVKVEGNVFETKVPLSNEGKDGLYYLTVWGSEGQEGKVVPISRRVINVTGGKENPAQATQTTQTTQTTTDSNTGEITSPQTSKKDEKSAKKAKKNKTAPPSS